MGAFCHIVCQNFKMCFCSAGVVTVRGVTVHRKTAKNPYKSIKIQISEEKKIFITLKRSFQFHVYKEKDICIVLNTVRDSPPQNQSYNIEKI